MKAYEIGEEVFAIVMGTVEVTDIPLNASTVIKSKILNRVEPDEDPSNFLYELEGNQGMVKAKKIFSNVKDAKAAALDSIKDPNARTKMKKKLDATNW